MNIFAKNVNLSLKIRCKIITIFKGKILLLRKYFYIIYLMLHATSSKAQLQTAWPVNQLSNIGQNYASFHHNLLAEVNYTPKKIQSGLFNYVNWENPPPDNRISMKGLSRLNYRDGIWLRNSFIFQRGSSINVFSLGTLGAAYAISYDTDTADNYYVLFDLININWTPQNPCCFNPADSTQIMICKYTSNGTMVWYKKYGGSSAEYGVKIRRSVNGDLLVVAETQSGDGDVTGYSGGKDIWLLKLNAQDGNIIWKKTIGSDKDEEAKDIEIHQDGSMIIAGSAESSTLFPSSYAGKNAFVQKLDANGNPVFTQVFGGDGHDVIEAISLTPTGFVSLSSSTSTNGTFPSNAGGRDIYVMNHNATGNTIWSKHYGNTQDDEPGDIVYISCESRIFASYAKEFNNNTYFNSSPPVPIFAQRAGVRIGLNLNATEFFYMEDAFNYPNMSSNGDDGFNYRIYASIDTNDRGGILTGGFTHFKWGTSVIPGVNGTISRSFDLTNFGDPLRFEILDTSICKGTPIFGINYNADTTFYDTLRNHCNVDTLIIKKTIRVINSDDSVRNNDTLVCYGQIYKGQPVYASFTDRDTTVLNTTCGPKNHIVLTNVIVPPPITAGLGPDTTFCPPGGMLNVSLTGASYLWSNGSTSSSQYISSSGLYWVEITDSNQCTKRDTAVVTISDIYLQIWNDTTIQLGSSVTLLPQTNGSILWQPNPFLSCFSCSSPVASPAETTLFYLSSTKGDCILSDSVLVVINKGFYFYIPNAFTPNNDGLNDFFGPIANLISDYTMTIYNRWGQKIFQTISLAKNWDGKFLGVPQDSGVFVYTVSFKDPDKKTHFYKGSFTLIR